MVSKFSKVLKIFIFCFIALLFIFELLFVTNQSGIAAVTLIYFNAVLDGNRVRFTWETGTEMSNLGFYIERSDETGNNYQQINLLILSQDICDVVGGTPTADGCIADLILAMGDISGHKYQNIFDTSIETGKKYLYRLVAIDSGGHEESSDPENPWATPSPTITHAKTQTSIISSTTATITQIISTSTPKKTKTPILSFTSTSRYPTVTAKRYSPTVTPLSPSPSPSALPETLTPTEAIIAAPVLPMPSITLIFPDTATPMIENTPTPLPETHESGMSWFTPQRITVLGLIISIWVILGGAFFFVIKKIE